MLPSVTPYQTEYTVNKPIGELIMEVFQENFDDFRLYLSEREIIKLELSRQLSGNGALSLLSQALQGTNVTTLSMRWNEIDKDGAIGFAENLKGTSVTTVDLSFNVIGKDGAIGLAGKLKGTSVTTVNLTGNGIGYFGNLALQQSLEIQNYLAAYAVMVGNGKVIDINQGAPQSRRVELSYAFDIIKKLPVEVAAKIAEYCLPQQDCDNRFALALEYDLAPQDGSPFLNLARFLYSGKSENTREEDALERPLSKRQKTGVTPSNKITPKLCRIT